MKPFKPGEIVTLREQDFKIVATNYEGKLILHPVLGRQKESIADMTVRLQSTVDEPSEARVEAPKD